MRWINLDFGAHQIKALKCFVEGNRIEIEDFVRWESKPEYFEGLDFPSDQAWAAVSVGLNELNWLDTDSEAAVISHLPASYLESRYLRFPFRQEKKISRVLPLELESASPFDLDEIIIKHRLLRPNETRVEKDGHVLVLSYRRELIQKYETQLRQFQVSPPSISVDALTLVGLRQVIHSAHHFALLSIGHKKSSLLLTNAQGHISAVRVFWWGGEKIRESLSKRLKIDPQEAQKILETKASLQVTQETASTEMEIAEAIEESFTPFLNELRQSLKSLQVSEVNWTRPLQVFSIGKVASIPGLLSRLKEPLQSEFDLEFHNFPYESLYNHVSGLEKVDDLVSATPVLGAALVQTKNNRSKTFNFSESSFQFQQNLKKLQSESLGIVKKIALLLIAPFVYLVASAVITSMESNRVEAALREQLERSRIEVSESANLSEIEDQVQRQLISFRQKANALSEDQSSPLLVLSNLSRSISSQHKVDMKNFKVDSEQVRLNFETDSSSSQNEILESIQVIYPDASISETRECDSYENCRSFSLEFSRPEVSE